MFCIKLLQHSLLLSTVLVILRAQKQKTKQINYKTNQKHMQTKL